MKPKQIAAVGVNGATGHEPHMSMLTVGPTHPGPIGRVTRLFGLGFHSFVFRQLHSPSDTNRKTKISN
jgi:hypothetical protein